MIPHEPIFCNIRDNKNLGDMLCSARSIFEEWPNAVPIDFRDVPDGPEPLIVGGGGMLHPGVDNWIAQQGMRRMVFTVGIGLNYHDPKQQHGWEYKLRPAVLAGLRDKSVAITHERFTYCPCPTAGAIYWEDLREKATHNRDVCIFQHYDRPIGFPFDSSIPRFTNLWSPGTSLEETAKYLGEFETVVTNSYHGALWSARMGCNVVVWRPFSSRFQTGLPFRVTIAKTMAEYRAAVDTWKSGSYKDDVHTALMEDYIHLCDFVDSVLGLLT